MLVVVLFGAFSFTSCGGDDDDPVVEPSTLRVSTPKLEFTALGGESSFTVTSNTSWTVNGAKSWCYVSITQGKGNKEIIVEVDKNTTKDERTCRLTISTTDGLTQDVTIKQEAAETTVSVSPSEITFNGESGLKDEFTITTNGKWTISGKPDWLNVPTSGEGETKCKIETTEANDTDKERTAELKINAGGKTANLRVIQKGLRVRCYIEAKNIVALCEEIGFELQPTGDVDVYKYIIHLGEDVDNKRVTDKDIEDELKQEDGRKLADNNPIIFPNYFYSNGNYYYMQEDTKYYICTIAYDSKGNPGALKKEPIRTRKSIDPDYDAYVSFNNANAYSDAIEFECKKEGYCDSYHLIYGNMPSENFTKALFAFEINYYLKNKKKHWYAEQRNLKIETYYPNTHTFVHYYTKPLAEWPLIIIAAWGVFKDGSVSSDLNIGYLDASAESKEQHSQKHLIQQMPVSKKSNVLREYNKKEIENRVIY